MCPNIFFTASSSRNSLNGVTLILICVDAAIFVVSDDQSVTEQSTEESLGFSEDSQADLPHAAQEDDIVTSQWFVTQELDAGQLFDDEIVKDIVERLVRAVCSNNDDNEAAIVKETVEKIVTMASQNHESDVFVAKNILDDLVEKVVEKVSEAKSKMFFNKLNT